MVPFLCHETLFYKMKKVIFTVLLVFSSIFFCFQNLTAQEFRVQLAAFTKQVPFTYFAFSGINNVYSNRDQNEIYRYYMSDVYYSAEAAERTRKILVNRGFVNAQIIDITKEKSLCSPQDPAFNQGVIYTNLMTEQLYFRNIYFDFDRHILSAESKAELDEVAKMLKANPKLKANISGHTDSKGSPEYNVKLSLRRAKQARSYLVNKGVHFNRIHVKVYGESTPIAVNFLEDGMDAPQGRHYNRRVVVTLTDRFNEVVMDTERMSDIPGYLRINKQTLRQQIMHAQVKRR